MKLINRAIRAGKTYEVVREFLNSNSLLLVMSEEERKRIISEYAISKEKQRDIINWQNHDQKTAGTNKDLLMDNADYFLQEQFRGRFKIISMQCEQ